MSNFFMLCYKKLSHHKKKRTQAVLKKSLRFNYSMRLRCSFEECLRSCSLTTVVVHVMSTLRIASLHDAMLTVVLLYDHSDVIITHLMTLLCLPSRRRHYTTVKHSVNRFLTSDLELATYHREAMACRLLGAGRQHL